MGRPKKNVKKTEATASAGTRVVIMHLKGTPEYAAWLDRAFAKTHIPKTSMYRLAMIEWAEKNGLEPPPEL